MYHGTMDHVVNDVVLLLPAPIISPTRHVLIKCWHLLPLSLVLEVLSQIAHSSEAQLKLHGLVLRNSHILRIPLKGESQSSLHSDSQGKRLTQRSCCARRSPELYYPLGKKRKRSKARIKGTQGASQLLPPEWAASAEKMKKCRLVSRRVLH